MKTVGVIAVAAVAVLALGAGVYMVDIDQTEEAEFPEVSVEGGNLPEFDAEMGSISIGEQEVTVPTLEVTPPEGNDVDTASN